MELDIVEKRIIDLLKEGKSTVDISGILTKEGHRTIKGDVYLRKAVNNRITMMRAKGLEIPLLRGESEKKYQPRMIPVEPFIYKAQNGKFRFRKAVKGNIVCRTFPSLSEAQKYKSEVTSSPEEIVPVLTPPTFTPPKLSKIVFAPTVEEKSSKTSVIITDNNELVLKLVQEAWRN